MTHDQAISSQAPFDIPAATVLVPTSSIMKTFARLCAAVLALAFVALFSVPWQQSSLAKGRVIAFGALDRRQSIDAPVEGRVLHWYVAEGQRVQQGDLLVEIADNDPAILERIGQEKAAVEARIEAAKARVASMEGRIDALTSSRQSGLSAADARVKMARDRARAAEQGVRAAEAAEKTAALNLERIKKLQGEGLQSKRALELAELEHVRSITDLDRARASFGAARSEESALMSDLAKVGNDLSASISDASASKAAALAEIANGAAELSRLDVRIARQSTQRVTAPRDGAIFRIIAKQGGDFVKAADPLAILVPDTDDRAVELWIDGNDINLVFEGRKARLQFEGWPAVQFSGWPSASVGTYGGVVSIVDSSDDGEGRFRVVVTPDPDEPPWPQGNLLRQGTRANGWVLFDQVSLGYELWRTLNGFPPEWPHATDAKETSTDAKGKGEKK
ncbi:MAG: HlyD family efflux transporter periplasmic adaptor subunit [Byssovorax sp.]